MTPMQQKKMGPPPPPPGMSGAPKMPGMDDVAPMPEEGAGDDDPKMMMSQIMSKLDMICEALGCGDSGMGDKPMDHSSMGGDMGSDDGA